MLLHYSTSAPKLEPISGNKTMELSWSPKKEYYDTQKQLDKIIKRVNLLKIETEIREKKVQVYNQKSELLSKVRDDHEQFKEFKLAMKEKMNIQLQNLVSRTRNVKQQMSQDKLTIQQNLYTMKRQEVKNLKEQSLRNEYLIKQNLDTLKQQKHEQKLNVIGQEMQSQQAINNFRKQRFIKFMEEHSRSKSQHCLDAEIKQQQIEELRKQEAYLVSKLDETIQQSEKAKLNMSSMKLLSSTPKTASNFYG